MRSLKALGAILAVLILVASPVAAQQTATTDGIVKVNDVGRFEVKFCQSNINFKVGGSGGTNPVVTSHTSATTEGAWGICIYDTRSYRGEFTISVQAGDFQSITPGVTASIDVENLYMWNVVNPRHASATALANPARGMIYSVSPIDKKPAISTGSANTAKWGDKTYDLGTSRTIVTADAGMGIGKSDTAEVRPGLYLKLEVPPGTRAATYRTTITLTVDPATP